MALHAEIAVVVESLMGKLLQYAKHGPGGSQNWRRERLLPNALTGLREKTDVPPLKKKHEFAVGSRTQANL